MEPNEIAQEVFPAEVTTPEVAEVSAPVVEAAEVAVEPTPEVASESAAD